MAQSLGHGDQARTMLLGLLKAESGHEADRLTARFSHADWTALIRHAGHHGLLGVLDGVLGHASALPAAVREAVDRRRTVASIWHARLLDVIAAAAGAMGDRGITPMALKGPVLAERLYPRHASRHSVDVDLLVGEPDLEAAIETLQAIGYVCESGPRAEYSRRHGHHVHLGRRGSPPIELHFCAYAGFGVTLPAPALLARAVAFPLEQGGTVLVPAPEDEFVYLSTHAAGHSFIRLMWLYDLQRLIGQSRALDWAAIGDRAAALHVGGPVAYTVRLLRHWFDVHVEGVPERLLRRGVRSRMADWLLPAVSTPQPTSAIDNVGGLLFTSLLCDRTSAGLGLMRHHFSRSLRRHLKRHLPVLPDAWSA